MKQLVQLGGAQGQTGAPGIPGYTGAQGVTGPSGGGGGGSSFGSWAPSTPYVTDSTVMYKNVVMLRCLTPHTSGSTLAPDLDKWASASTDAEITATAGLSQFEPVYPGAGWGAAKADDANTLASNFVLEASATYALLVQSGSYTYPSHGLPLGTLYCSPFAAGTLTATEPDPYVYFVNQVLYVESTSVFVVTVAAATAYKYASGSTGIPGVTGAPGPQGLTGYQGLTGPDGAAGITGFLGATGSPGPQGLTGTPGMQGPTGSVGFQGITGLSGLQGATGAFGITGSRGLTGFAGLQGATGGAGVNGVTGASGLTGIQGPQGLTGQAGVAGPTGSQGIAGAAGATGSSGLQGLTGQGGLQGATGTNGLAGAQGITGQGGLQGLTGAAGVTGTSGAQGLTGNSGLQGLTGINGLQGGTGLNGLQGSTGIAGPQGLTGLQGITGPIGLQGLTGTVGLTGTIGVTGTPGITGRQGITGQNGLQGITGSNGLQGATGGNGLQGLTGTNGLQGLTGSNGIQGATGQNGLQGLTGLNGLQGITGQNGLQGITGPNGLQGITGAAGLTGSVGLQGLTGAGGLTGITWGVTGFQGFTGLQGVTGVGNYSYSTTFTNASLVAGVLTVTHGLGTQNCVYTVKDNNNKALTPDDVTFNAGNTALVDLSTFGALTGTWSVTIMANGGLATSSTFQQVYLNSASQPQISNTAGLGAVLIKGANGSDTSPAFGIVYGATGTSSFTVNGEGTVTMPKASGTGIKVDPAVPTWGWRDITGILRPDLAGANAPVLTVFRGGSVRSYAYQALDKMDCEFHIPHDYVPGTDIYIHVHWSHNGTAISGNFVGTCAYTYAKGHNQAVFPAEKTVTITYATVNVATTPQYIHRIDEVVMSSAGGSASLLDNALLEVDGMILLNFTMTTIPTITGGSNRVFISHIDVHYQSNNMATKQKAPSFYT